MTIPETGMEILRTTRCRVGMHVWTTLGTSTSGGARQGPEPEDRCDCGLLAWREVTA